MSGAAKRKLKKQQEKSITKLRKLDDLGFINIVAPTNMSESSASTTVDQSGDRACNELNSSNPEGMIPLEAEALSLGSHAESGYEDNAYPGYPIEKCSSSECKSSSSLLREYSGDVALWKNISKEWTASFGSLENQATDQEMTSAGETHALKWSKYQRRWCLVLVAKPDIEKEDMNAADEFQDDQVVGVWPGTLRLKEYSKTVSPLCDLEGDPAESSVLLPFHAQPLPFRRGGEHLDIPSANGILQDEKEDILNFSYSSDEDFPSDMTFKPRGGGGGTGERKSSASASKPSRPPSRMSRPPPPCEASSPVSASQQVPSPLRPKNDMLDKQRRRLSSMVPRPIGSAASPTTATPTTSLVVTHTIPKTKQGTLPTMALSPVLLLDRTPHGLPTSPASSLSGDPKAATSSKSPSPPPSVAATTPSSHLLSPASDLRNGSAAAKEGEESSDSSPSSSDEEPSESPVPPSHTPQQPSLPIATTSSSAASLQQKKNPARLSSSDDGEGEEDNNDATDGLHLRKPQVHAEAGSWSTARAGWSRRVQAKEAMTVLHRWVWLTPGGISSPSRGRSSLTVPLKEEQAPRVGSKGPENPLRSHQQPSKVLDKVSKVAQPAPLATGSKQSAGVVTSTTTKLRLVDIDFTGGGPKPLLPSSPPCGLLSGNLLHKASYGNHDNSSSPTKPVASVSNGRKDLHALGGGASHAHHKDAILSAKFPQLKRKMLSEQLDAEAPAAKVKKLLS
eukprot:Em0014g413a